MLVIFIWKIRKKQNTEIVNDSHVFSSKEVIEMVLEKLRLSREFKSIYQQSI